MKKIVALIVLLAIIVAGYIAAGPFIAIHEIKSGVEHQDPEKISAYADFSALRTNLKEQINALFMKQVASDLKDNPFAALGMAFASKLAEGMVDSFVTPASLSNLMAGKKPQQPNGVEGPQESNSQKPEPFKDARYTYDSSSKFSVWVKNDSCEETRFVLTRNGLSWKLSNIVIPTNLFDSIKSASAKTHSSDELPASASKPLDPPTFEVVLRNKAFQQANYREGIQNAITIEVAFRNLSGKDIRAFDGLLKFTDLLDNKIYLARVAINDPVAASATLEWAGEIPYNQFDESLQHLKKEDFANLKIYFKIRKVLFADGNTKEFDAEQEQLAADRRKVEAERQQLAMGKRPSVSTARQTGKDGRFVAYNDGTVLDTNTNLMWAAKDNGSNINWANSKKYCENYRGGGYSDWRMPTQDELAELYDADKTYRSDCVFDVHLTKLIHLTCSAPWASETRDTMAAICNFNAGGRDWTLRSYDFSLRALPVRNAK